MDLSIIIIAAGQGTRMRSDKPKVLQPLAGQPLLQHVVNCAKAVGAADICVVYGFGGDAVAEQINDPELRWVLQAEQLGTGHAVQQAMPGTPDGNRVLILCGDVPLLRATTLKRLIGKCEARDVAVLTVDVADPFGYGRIVRKNGRVLRIVEQKDANEAEQGICEINTGVITAPAGQLMRWLAELGNDNSQGEYYLTDIISMAAAADVTVHGVKAYSETEIMGINDKKQLAEAERAKQLAKVEALMTAGVGFADPARVDIRGTLTCGKDVYIDVNAVFEGDVRLGDNVIVESNNVVRDSDIGPGTVIHPNCHIEGATSGADCQIGPFARLRPGAELANNVKVGNFVEIKKSTVGDGSKVNHLTYIGDATIGKSVNVGAGTITCNYDGAFKHQTVIGDNAFIGSGVELVAPVEIGADATVGAGATISRPAPAGKLTIERAKQVTIEGWKRPKKQ